MKELPSKRSSRGAGLIVFVVMMGALEADAADPAALFAAGETLSAQKVNAAFGGMEQRLAVLERAVGSAPAGTPGTIPPGTIVAYGGSTPPFGWLMCEGQELNQAGEPDLFAAIGIAFGGGGATFRVPDLRGRFVRGTDNGQGRDPDAMSRAPSNVGGNDKDKVGSLQGPELQSHTHLFLTPGYIQAGASGPGQLVFGPASNQAVTLGAGGSETRPVNVAVSYIIKR